MATPGSYQTYIFDLDGTLTDTSVVWLGIFRDCLLQCDVKPPDTATLAKHTHDWRQMLELGLPESKLDDFIALAHKLALERLPEAPLHKDAKNCLEALKRHGKAVAIFSTADRPIFEAMMKHHGLDKMVDAAVAGTDVPRRKPHPDGILKALDELNLGAQDERTAVYIGDKDTDIQAAQNASIASMLFYPDSHQVTYDLDAMLSNKPDHVIHSWQGLLDSINDGTDS